MNTPRIVAGVFAVLMSLTLGACVSTRRAPEPAAALNPKGVTFFDGASGEVVAWDGVIAKAKAADVVVLGENHGHPLGLAVAASIWEEVSGGEGSQAALAMEFLERDQQSRVDDYLTDVTDESTFKHRTGRTEGSYPPGHRAMVEFAKAKGRPVIAANAPTVYVRAVKKKGYEGLSALGEEQKRLFRIPDELPTGKYREDFDKVMGGMESHGEGAKPKGKGAAKEPTEEEKAAAEKKKREQLDAAFKSQSLWDWTMGESIVRAKERGLSPVVQVVGRFHCDYRGGLVQAVEKMRPGTSVVTISFVDESRSSLKDEDRGRADFVVYVGPSRE